MSSSCSLSSVECHNFRSLCVRPLKPLKSNRFVERRVGELEEQEAAAIAAAAADGTLPPLSLPSHRYTAGIISPRLGSPAYLASRGFNSGGGAGWWGTGSALEGVGCSSSEAGDDGRDGMEKGAAKLTRKVIHDRLLDLTYLGSFFLGELSYAKRWEF